MEVDLRKKIILAFYKKDTIMSYLMKLFNIKNKYSHVEIIDEDMNALNVILNSKSKFSKHTLDSEKWDYIYIKVSLYEYNIVKENMKNLVGLKLNSFKKMYCVEVVNKSLYPVVRKDFGNINVDTFYNKIIRYLSDKNISNDLSKYI